MQLDLASLNSVREFGAGWARRGLPLHVLLNNAGLFALGQRREDSADGFESHLATNYLGHFLLTLLLLPSLQQAAAQVRGCDGGCRCRLRTGAGAADCC